MSSSGNLLRMLSSKMSKGSPSREGKSICGPRFFFTFLVVLLSPSSQLFDFSPFVHDPNNISPFQSFYWFSSEQWLLVLFFRIHLTFMGLCTIQFLRYPSHPGIPWVKLKIKMQCRGLGSKTRCCYHPGVNFRSDFLLKYDDFYYMNTPR